MKRWQLFAVILTLYPTLCLSCGEPGVDYSIEVSANPLEPVLGETVELRCRVGDSSQSRWANGVVSRGSNLIWTEGGVKDWSKYNGRELISNSTAGEAILRIANFSHRDYGVYSCRCVNDFTYLQYRVCGGEEGLPTHCSAAAELRLLPPGTRVNTVNVNISGTKVSLPECTSGWIQIDSSGSHEEKVSSDVVVNSPLDQAKFLCISSTTNTPKDILYVEIEDYHPLRILYPVSNTADLVLDRTGQIPVCATLSPSGTTTTTLLLHINGTVMRLEPDAGNAVVALDEEQCGWVIIYSVDELVVNVTLEEVNKDSFFSCTVSSQWESLTRNFTIHENRTSQPQVCPSLSVSSNSDASSVTRLMSSPISAALPPPNVLFSISQIASPVSSLAPPLPSTTPQTASPVLPLPSNDGSKNELPTPIIAGAAGGLVVVLLIIVGVVLLLVCVRRRRKTATRRMYKLPLNDDSFVAEPNLTQPSFNTLSSNTLQLSNGHTIGHQFAHNGVPISRQMAKCISSLQQSPWLFPYEKLEFLEELGSGAFGVVRKALAHSLQPGEPATIVAVKMLKDDAASEDEEKDLISELKVLKHVGAHPNIVCLLGAAINNGMLHVIVEYCCNGNLLSYLRSKRKDQSSPLTVRHCVDMAAQVATGMEFLTSKDCIHRDLAARNVLITEDNVLKVADFGLARKVYESVYRPSGGKVPVKWMAPESIIDHVYTAQSDVWSFGIVLWEILTLGRTPYPGKSAETMLRDLEDGYRMPRPPSCPVQIYDVMLKCWQWSSANRPTFSDLVKQLEEILSADEPALNRHYYNMEVGGQTNRDSTIDSTLCSCEDLLDSSIDGPVNTCHSCGNSFTTTRVLSSDPAKVFCDDCSQMPEYLSRSSLDLLSTCDDGMVGKRAGRRWSHRIHSNDSGVKVSSEGTSSDLYQITSGARAAAFARQLAESLQSMCSECKMEMELEPGLGSTWAESSLSISSLCTDCRDTLEGHKYTNMLSPTIEEISREREEYMKQRMDRLLASPSPGGGRPRPQSTDESLLLLRSGREEGEGSAEGEGRGEGEGEVRERVDIRENGVGDKVELRQKYSNDSGIKLMPELVYLKRVSAPPLSGNQRMSGSCFSPPTPRILSLQTSGCSTPASRLSAHPRNRDLFEELGFTETDL